jgi:hypothetical protein
VCLPGTLRSSFGRRRVTRQKRRGRWRDVIFSLVPTDTINLATGQYWYQVVAENGTGDRIFIAEGTVFKLIGKITGTGPMTGALFAEKILEAIDQRCSARRQGSAVVHHSVRFGIAQSITSQDHRTHGSAQSIYAGIVAAEKRAANGTPTFQETQIRFVAD